MAIDKEYRRSLSELEKILKYEPDFKILIVEGPIDKSLLTNFREMNKLDYQLYCIDNFQVDSTSLSELNIENNNRGRLLFMSLRLKNYNSLRVIVDKDFHPIIEDTIKSSVLLYTDYSNMESYLINKEIFQRFQVSCLFTFPLEIEKILENMIVFLNDFFIERICFKILGWNINDFQLIKKSEYKDGFLSIDLEKHMTEYIKSKQYFSNVEEYKELKRKYSEINQTGNLEFIHGHDFISTFTYFYNCNINKASGKGKKKKRSKELNEFGIERLLYSLLDKNFLLKFPLFKSLATW